MPVISEAEIEDRSKGDGLSKGIAILQLAWFVVQLVARYIQNLPITLLEIDTLAVAALACIPYGLWWKKPKGVGCPYIVHLKAAAALPDQLTYNNTNLHFANSYGLDGNNFPPCCPFSSCSISRWLRYVSWQDRTFRWMFQWDGVWRGTLSRLELLFSQAHRAHIMARNFPWGNMCTSSSFARYPVIHAELEEFENIRMFSWINRLFHLYHCTCYATCTSDAELTITTYWCIR
ncbi:hypothetical protein BDR05DRAFT_1059678 [Suillus weaverae]|nr:hypothetical protein BDR05DRAFT_1059678 [Suillus weaverae]